MSTIAEDILDSYTEEEAEKLMKASEELMEKTKKMEAPVLRVDDIDDKFMKYFTHMVSPERIPTEKSDSTVYEFRNEEGDLRCVKCSYLGYVYEDIDDNAAIEDFARKLTEIYNKYTVIAQLATTMKMPLVSTPKHPNRFMLLHYIFFKEQTWGEDSRVEIKEDIIFDPDQGCPITRLFGPPRKHVKVFTVPHILTLSQEDQDLNRLDLVKKRFKDLPEDLEFVEDMAVISPSFRILCTSKSFPEDEVLEEYAENITETEEEKV